MHFLSQTLETRKSLGTLTSANKIAAQAISEIVEYTIAVLLEIHTYKQGETKNQNPQTNQLLLSGTLKFNRVNFSSLWENSWVETRCQYIFFSTPYHIFLWINSRGSRFYFSTKTINWLCFKTSYGGIKTISEKDYLKLQLHEIISRKLNCYFDCCLSPAPPCQISHLIRSFKNWSWW